jgi:RNA polymerase sigma-70 factor (ECF subfamily)
MDGGTTVSGVRDARFDALWREHRGVVLDLAFKLLGSFAAAEDAAQEAFARLLRADIDAIDDVRAWLVVVTTRLCLDDLRSARSTRVDLAGSVVDVGSGAAASPDPADRVTLDERIRHALVVVLQQLSPAERAVFVLHDVFGFPFPTVASIVGRSPDACRKLATRARAHVRATEPARFDVLPSDEHRVTERFIAACAGGDLGALMELLDPDVVGDVELGTGVVRGTRRGADDVAHGLLHFFGGADGVTLVGQPIDGQLGVLAFRDRELFALATFEVDDGGLITDIHAVADPSAYFRTLRQVFAEERAARATQLPT